ncbi:MAG: hypothetical protein IT473_12450 [Lysobacter sp.]|nr:hypothetical protein [Lysobacter sp.]
MSHRFERLRIALVVLTLAASAAVGFAQNRARTASPEREAKPMAAQDGAAGVAAEAATPAAAAPKPRYPVVNDPRLVASPTETFLGPSGASNPFAGTAMTENQCRAMENCEVVQGQGPSYATWCRCGKKKLTTFTYIHD